MTNNKLKELPDGLKYLESIETMNFQNNDIKQVDMDIGSDLPSLKRVDLTKNPLKKVPPPVWKKKEEGIILVDDNVKEGINADDAMEMAQDKAQEAKKALKAARMSTQLARLNEQVALQRENAKYEVGSWAEKDHNCAPAGPQAASCVRERC